MGTETGAVVATLLEDHLAGGLSLAAAKQKIGALFPEGIPKLAAVTGWPLTYTRSPLLHNHWCRQYGINGLYLRLPIAPERFQDRVRALQRFGFAGLNVTIPHKEAAFQLVDRRSRTADRAGAVNTLIFKPDGQIFGECTDGTGYVSSLAEKGVCLPLKVLVLGAGGASRAVCAALLDAGCDLTIANRTRSRAEGLAEALDGGEVSAWEDWSTGLHAYDLLVNTTSLGMSGQDSFDWADGIANASPSLVVSDIVYVPLETPLLKAARKRGLATVDGLGMLIYQARPGFAAWFGRMPEVGPEVRENLIQTLG